MHIYMYMLYMHMLYMYMYCGVRLETLHMRHVHVD